MENNFAINGFDEIFKINKILTFFYKEYPKNFSQPTEKHDFWEMLYVDKGEIICKTNQKQHIIKSGEMVFLNPNEPYSLSGNDKDAPNVNIITFECNSLAMSYFEGKTFKLNAEEKSILSIIISEGIYCCKLIDQHNSPLHKSSSIPNAPYGSSQLMKNYFEIFLIMLCRKTDVLTKKTRRNYTIDGATVPHNVKEILKFLEDNINAKITIKDVARYIGKSESTVKQLFSRYREDGIMKYYNSLKIKEAKRMIREGNINFTQIAENLGFDNPQYFSKCFKNITEMTPTEYKASIMK